MANEFYCASCGRRRLTHRCGCIGTRADAERLLRMAQVHREAAAVYPAHALANLADAERLERLAVGAAR